ncbi:MAG: SRPBCC family protein [Planctomycetes bacterium]|nr:SRPBCC family protein [Planctomycetota bacterium]
MKMRYRVLMVALIVSSVGWVYTIATGIPDDRGGVIAARQAFASSAPEIETEESEVPPDADAGLADAEPQNFSNEAQEVRTAEITGAISEIADDNPLHLLPFLQDGVLSHTSFKEEDGLSWITAYCLIEANAKEVWDVVSDIANWKSWSPKCLRSEVRPVEFEGDHERCVVHMSLDAPVSAVNFTEAVWLYEDRFYIRESVVSGDLRGGVMSWRLIPVPDEEKTIVEYRCHVSTKNAGVLFNAVISADPTIDTGINLATVAVRLLALRDQVAKRN